MVLVCVVMFDWYTVLLLSVRGWVSGLLLAAGSGSKNLALSSTFLDVLVFFLGFPGVLGLSKSSWVLLLGLVLMAVRFLSR